MSRRPAPGGEAGGEPPIAEIASTLMSELILDEMEDLGDERPRRSARNSRPPPGHAQGRGRRTESISERPSAGCPRLIGGRGTQRPFPSRASSPMQLRISVSMGIDVAPANQNNVMPIALECPYASSPVSGRKVPKRARDGQLDQLPGLLQCAERRKAYPVR